MDSTSTTANGNRQRLHELFHQIEKEFDAVLRENLFLQEKVDILNDKLESVTSPSERSIFDSNKKVYPRNFGSGGQKLKTAHKLKAQTSKIVSSFKPSLLHGCQVREYIGHKDGIWEMAVSRNNVIGTASADHTAMLWNADTGKSLILYQGHKGSVNSIRFHNSKDLILTSSGDCTAHLWQSNIETVSPKGLSSEEEIESMDDVEVPKNETTVLKSNLVQFEGHSGPVSAADFISGNDQMITVSWDRTALLHDIEYQAVINTLTGHDLELTNLATHPIQKLAVTTSKDTTFRLWDFRETVHAVSVFQGHSESVNSAVFTRDDKVVSSSDDRTVKVWDLKNMRSPLVTIRTVSSNNRISISGANVIAIPHDNRHIRLFDLSGQRLARLPHSSRIGHRLMVTCTAWGSDTSLFSAAFDRHVIQWNILSCKAKASKNEKDKDKECDI